MIFSPKEYKVVWYSARSPRSDHIQYVKHSGYWWRYTWVTRPNLLANNTVYYTQRSEPEIEVFGEYMGDYMWLQVMLGGGIAEFLDAK